MNENGENGNNNEKARRNEHVFKKRLTSPHA